MKLKEKQYKYNL